MVERAVLLSDEKSMSQEVRLHFCQANSAIGNFARPFKLRCSGTCSSQKLLAMS